MMNAARGRQPSPIDAAVVLAGGGIAGIAWEIGVLCGIADVDAALAERVLLADLVIGTSAGAAVAAQITSGALIQDLYAAQLRPETAEIEPVMDLVNLTAEVGAALAGATGPADAGRRLGALALRSSTVEPGVRRAVIEARLPTKHWPDRQHLFLPAVDAESGEATVFTGESGVDLVDAVAASCALPGVWPPVEIDGRFYIDGGARSPTNADLAAGAARVLIIRPFLQGDSGPTWTRTPREIEALAPAEVYVLPASRACLDAFGDNPLSPATRSASARAGRALGASRARELAAWWN